MYQNLSNQRNPMESQRGIIPPASPTPSETYQIFSKKQKTSHKTEKQNSYMQPQYQSMLQTSLITASAPVNVGASADRGLSMGTQVHSDYPCHSGDRHLAVDIYGRDVPQTTLKKHNPACENNHVDIHTLGGILLAEHSDRPDTDHAYNQRVKSNSNKYMPFAGKAAVGYPAALYGAVADVSVKEKGYVNA